MAARSRAYLLSHRAHDAAALRNRWRDLLAQVPAEWVVMSLGEAGDHPIWAIASQSWAAAEDRPIRRARPHVPSHPSSLIPHPSPAGLYVSAGVHGDEAAPPWGVWEWFERHHARLAVHPVFIVPCFNPIGLVLNTRTDHFNEDLNRQFHRDDHPIVSAWRSLVARKKFQLALCLHEDYDAQGLYAYELSPSRAPRLGDHLLEHASAIIPRDPRPQIEGRPAVNGLIRRTRRPRGLPGTPEAVALLEAGVPHTLTFETPSEYSLHDRVRCHAAFLEEAVHALGW